VEERGPGSMAARQAAALERRRGGAEPQGQQQGLEAAAYVAVHGCLSPFLWNQAAGGLAGRGGIIRLSPGIPTYGGHPIQSLAGKRKVSLELPFREICASYGRRPWPCQRISGRPQVN